MILTLNAGSSSLKFALFAFPSSDSPLLEGLIEGIGKDGLDHQMAFQQVVSQLQTQNHFDQILAIGHRVVHGGVEFGKPVIVDAQVEATIERLIPLAPLHNPANLLGIQLCRQLFAERPGSPPLQVAVFDTAFHATLPEVAYRYPVPQQWYKEFGVRKYGFHGTSHAYVSAEARQVLTQAHKASTRMISLHLGNGCSAAAILDGVCIDTSMGLTPLAGLMMGTRPGDVDPGLAGHLRAQGLSQKEIDQALNFESGLRAIAGENDMRRLLAMRDAGSLSAKLAIDMYTYRIRKIIGAYVAALGGLDALIFTAGVGENSQIIRDEICAGLSCFGVSSDNSGPVQTLVVATNEELAIARQASKFLDPE